MTSLRVALVWLTTLSLAACGFTQGTPPEVKASQPILYVDADGVRAVYSDGRQLATRAPFSGGLPVWSPDGRWFTYVAKDQSSSKATLMLMSLEGHEKSIFTAEGNLAVGAWSPDGRNIALLLLGGPPSTVTIAVFEVNERKVISRHSLAPSAVPAGMQRVRWSADGRKILLSSATTLVIHIDTKEVETVVDKPVLAEWAPNSDAVYYFTLDVVGTDTGDFYLKRLGATAPIKLAERPEAAGLQRMKSFMTLSPRGSRLAIAWSSVRSVGGTVTEAVSEARIYDLAGGRTVQLDKPLKTYRTRDLMLDLQWSPDEAGLAAVATEQQDLSIKFLDLRTETWRTLAKPTLNETTGALYLFGLKTMSWTQ